MSEITVTKAGAATIVTIHRPHRRNAVNHATALALRQAFRQFDADPAARVAILTGCEGFFCAGWDLKEIATMDNELDGGPMGISRLAVGKPTIAAVAGHAVAGGLELACWCDLRVADETAVFGCFERRFGVPLVDGGTQRLPRIVGLGRALELILTGRAVDVHEAHAMGLVNEVVARGEHLSRAVELADAMARFPQICMNNDRRAVYEGLGRSMGDGLELEARIGGETLASGESFDGARAFTEGRGRGGAFD